MVGLILVFLFIIGLCLFTVHWSLGVLYFIALIGWANYSDWKAKEKRKNELEEKEKRRLPFDTELKEKHPNLKDASIIINNHRKWRLHFMFPGPNRRYNPTSFAIHDSQIDEYISALKDNFIKFKELKATLNSSTEVEIKGAKNMSIFIGGYFEGVCLYNHYLPIKTDKELAVMVEYLRYTKIRAEQIITSFIDNTNKVSC